MKIRNIHEPIWKSKRNANSEEYAVILCYSSNYDCLEQIEHISLWNDNRGTIIHTKKKEEKKHTHKNTH